MIGALGRDIGLYGVADFIFKMVSFAVFPIYASVLTLHEFGIMGLLSVFSGLISTLLNAGVNNAVQRFYWDPCIDDNQRPVLVSIGLRQLFLIGSIVLSIALGGIYMVRDILADRYGIEWHLIMLVLFAILPDQVLQYCMDTLRLQFAPLRFVFLSFMKNILGVPLSIWFAVVQDMGLFGVFWGGLIASLLSVPIGLWMIRRDLIWVGGGELAGKIFSYGYPFAFAGFAYSLLSAMDRWMLAELSNTAEVGLLSIAFKFSMIVGFVNGAFAQAWSPYLIKVMREREDYKNVYSRVFSVWFCLLAILGFAICLFADEILRLLTPAEYWRGSTTMGIVVLSVVLLGTTQLTVVGISIEKRTKFITHGSWGTAIINFILNLVLIPFHGALGSALAALGSYLFLTCFYLYWSQKLHPIPLRIKDLIFCCVIFLCGALMPLWLGLITQGINLILLKVALILITLIAAWIVGIIDLAREN